MCALVPAATGKLLVPLPLQKFFLQPGLVCGTGAKKTQPSNTHSTRIDYGATIATVQLQYDTPTTLLLRGILKRGDPRHDAILDSFPGARPHAWSLTLL